MKTNGKHETSPSGRRQARRDDKIARLFIIDRPSTMNFQHANDCGVYVDGACSCRPLIPVYADGMTLTSKERQEAFRARQAMLGHTEVRGIFLPPELHAEIKKIAQEMLRKSEKTPK